MHYFAQAEQSIDCLNQRIVQLETLNETLVSNAEASIAERDYYRNYAEQLKLENSKKWRLQERDDWKALVDSVQKDRSRLQDECLSLDQKLQQTLDMVEELTKENDRYSRLLESTSTPVPDNSLNSSSPLLTSIKKSASTDSQQNETKYNNTISTLNQDLSINIPSSTLSNAVPVSVDATQGESSPIRTHRERSSSNDVMMSLYSSPRLAYKELQQEVIKAQDNVSGYYLSDMVTGHVIPLSNISMCKICLIEM